MRNIIRIFASDAKRIATNVVAVVVIMGLAVIPCLYAWFNIMSNWDPYGAESTKNLSVAVASSDEGVEIGGVELNVGNLIISNLKENKTIGWVFTDTVEEAVDGVHSGDYYAALVIDTDFSVDMISFLGGNVIHPKIVYYENEKKNAIAPKITGKVKTTVQEEVNSAFVSTLAQAILELSDYIASTDNGSTLTATALTRLNALDSDMNAYIAILDSYISIIDSSESLMAATQTVTQELGSMVDSSQAMMNSAQSAANSASNSVSGGADMITTSLKQLSDQLNSLYDTVDKAISQIQVSGQVIGGQVEAINTAVKASHEAFDTSMDTIKNTQPADSDVVKNIDAVDASFTQLETDLTTLQNASDQTSKDAQKLWEQVAAEMKTCRTEIDTLYDTYTTVVAPQLSNTMSSIQNSLIEVEGILNYSGGNVMNVASALDSYPDIMAIGKDSLIASRDDAVAMEGQLSQLISDMQSLEGNDQYAMLMSLIQTDSSIIADFISSPINLDSKPVYAVANNGSATAPFYIVLSIWVGALILVALLHTQIAKPIEGTGKLLNYERFFGRYMIFFLVGQLQTLITAFGALFYVKIQCLHPFLFVLACCICSFAFTLLLYSLTYAFGNVGEAIAVVLMVIQVAGSGGTFPIEVLPKVYQVMYEYMPFAYGMNAIRETVGGLYQNDYWVYISGMGVYIAVALVIGLLISIPCKKLNAMIEESKERTDLMV